MQNEIKEARYTADEEGKAPSAPFPRFLATVLTDALRLYRHVYVSNKFSLRVTPS